MQVPDVYSFTVKSHGQNLRFVISKNGKEYVCRKERSLRLWKFLNSDESSLFKGRLQLHKGSSQISVQAKGEVVSVIAVADLVKLVKTIPGIVPT